MSIRNDFRTRLLAESGVSALVVADGVSRIYAGFAPQGAPLPHIVLNTISDVPDHDMDGPNTWTEARIQVDCYGATPDAADALAEAVRNASDGFAGQTVGDSHVHWIFHEDSGDDPSPEAGNETRRRSRVRADYRIAYVKALPTL